MKERTVNLMAEKHGLTLQIDWSTKPQGVSDEQWQDAKDYAAGKWEAQPQGLRDDWEAVAAAILGRVEALPAKWRREGNGTYEVENITLGVVADELEAALRGES
jgi:hypothetical protein